MADDSDRTNLKDLASTFEKAADAASAEGVYAGSLIAPEEHAVAGGHESAPSRIRTQALGQEREPRPEVCFVRWGPMDGEPTPLRLSHTGFLLANDGLAAHDIEIADFAVGDESWTAEKLARIKRDGEEFVLVSSRAAQRWNLLGAMHNAWAVRAENMRDHSNYTVRVFARYRDAANIWYQSWADLTYIPNPGPSLGRLRFGATAFEYAGVTKGSAIASREQTSTAVPAVPDDHSVALDKGNLAILRGTDGEFKRAVTLDVARRFGGVSLRAIQDAARNGKLQTEGAHQQRRVLVDSLLHYFPPEK